MSGRVIPIFGTVQDPVIAIANGDVAGQSLNVIFGELPLTAAGTAVVGPTNVTHRRLAVAELMKVRSNNGNDTLTGSGARGVLIEGITANDVAGSEILFLNGVADVDTVNVYRCIHRIVVLSAGSTQTNTGTIIVRDKATGLKILGSVSPLVCISEHGWYLVPAGKNMYIREISLNADAISGGNPTVTWVIDFYSDLLGTGESKVQGYKIRHSITEDGTNIDRNGYQASKSTPGTFIEMKITTDKNNTTARGSIYFALVDV